MNRNFKINVLLTVAAFGLTLYAQPPLNGETQQEVVENVARLLQENYVFEDKGIEAGQHIKAKLRDGAYKNIKEAQLFAERLTEDLQSITQDKHMRVRFGSRRPAVQGPPESPIVANLRRGLMHQEFNFGFAGVSVLEGNVGYLDVRGFAAVEQMREHADRAMGLLSGVNALILDLRKNGGGDPRAVQYLCSYFFKAGVHLNSIYNRDTDTTTDFLTLDEVQGKRLPEVPIFVLTSAYTFSGGEECAYNLQTQKRATLIGETTGGGANPGGTLPAGHGFAVFVPTGRAINPVTGTNWEGVGVVPEIKVEAEKAYDVALEKAREAAEDLMNQRIKVGESFAASLQEQLDAAVSAAKKDGFDAAFSQFYPLMEKGFEQGFLDEGAVNLAGYQTMQRDPMAAALLLKGNTKRFPDSANVYDSFGDALDALGKTQDAVNSYRKAVALAEEGALPNLDAFKANLARAEAKL